MSTRPPPSSRGAVAIPPDLLPVDARKRREDIAIALVEARLETGTLSPEEADGEFLEIALERFAYLPADVLDELREVGRLHNEEPEMVESRSLAPGQNARRGDLS